MPIKCRSPKTTPTKISPTTKGQSNFLTIDRLRDKKINLVGKFMCWTDWVGF